jgi:outer membrane protein assembly factor BamB
MTSGPRTATAGKATARRSSSRSAGRRSSSARPRPPRSRSTRRPERRSAGKTIWWVKHKGHSPAIRSLYGNGLVYFTVGAGGELVAVKPGQGDVTASNIAWKASKGIGHKPSPLLVEDLIYTLADSGTVTCFDAKSGELVWTARVPGSYSASPVYADGAIWVFAEDGTSTIFQPGREFKEIGRNKLDGGKESKATPAFVGKSIFLRTESALYRLEAK